MRCSDWSSDGCSSDLVQVVQGADAIQGDAAAHPVRGRCCGAVGQQGGRILGANRAWHICKQCLELATLLTQLFGVFGAGVVLQVPQSGEPACQRSEEHPSELPSLMRISYAVFFLTTTQIPK